MYRVILYTIMVVFDLMKLHKSFSYPFLNYDEILYIGSLEQLVPNSQTCIIFLILLYYPLIWK